MDKKDLSIGGIYIIRHAGHDERAQYMGELTCSSSKRVLTHYKFTKFGTGRTVILRSTQKILRPESKQA